MPHGLNDLDLGDQILKRSVFGCNVKLLANFSVESI